MIKSVTRITSNAVTVDIGVQWETLTGREREKALQGIISKQLEIQDQAKWRLRLGNTTIDFQKQFSRIVKLVVVAKDVVTAAAASSPDASIAWAGVCIILPVRH